MPHLDEGTLHALLDGEIAAAELAGVERHLTGCAECRTRLDEARGFRDEAFGLIETLGASAELAGAAADVDRAIPAFTPRSPSPGIEDPLPAVAPAAPSAPRIAPTAHPIEARRPLLSRRARTLAWAATVVLAVGLGYRLGMDRDLAPAPADQLTPSLEPPRPTENAAGAPALADSPTDREAKAATVAPDHVATRKPAAAPAPAPAPKTSAVREREHARPEASRELLTSENDTKKLEDRDQQPVAAAPPPQPRLAARGAPLAANEVRGVVVDQAGRALADALVRVAGSKDEARSNGQGRFALPSLSGRTVTLDVIRIGYEPATVVAQVGDSNVQVPMKERLVSLEEAQTTASGLTAQRRAAGNALGRARKAGETAPLTADDAIQRLGGSIKLVDGLTAARYEAIDSLVRVTYRTLWGPLLLEQWRDDGELFFRLIVPAAAPADSTAAWTRRIR